jgi:signal transduction histidine kinase
LSHDPWPGHARIDALPLILECDKNGQIVWMNEAARLRFGVGGALTGILSDLANPALESVVLCFTRLLVWHDRQLIRAEMSARPAGRAGAELPSLGGLHSSLLRHIVDLQEIQLRLAARVRGQRRGNRRRFVEMLEQERQRVGRELHAGVGQALAAIRLQLETIGRELASPSDPVQTALTAIGELSAQALQQVRSVSHRLHPPDWQRLTLPEALMDLWRLSGIPERYRAKIELISVDRELPHDVKVLFYRAAQEAISNLIRHSGATEVSLKMRQEGDEITLTVDDNGRGFDTSTGVSGIGLLSIREQVRGLGGGFHVRSGANGTTLEVILPVPMKGEA